jgi:serine/threonine-protein kinase PknG
MGNHIEIPTICRDVKCGGAVDKITAACKACGTIYDGNPEAAAFASDNAGVSQTVSPLSPLSGRGTAASEPTILAEIIPVPNGTKPTVQVSALSLQATLGGGLIKMPFVPPTDRLGQINFDLRTPKKLRFCSQISCVNIGAAAGSLGNENRTRLYWPSCNLDKLPPNCRLEEEVNPADGQTITYFVPDCGYCRKCGTPFNFLPIKAGTMIDQFRVDGQFANGGDGMLYHGMDMELNTPVVLKALHNATNVKSLHVASHEVGALVTLQGQPGVLRVCGFKEYDKRPLIIMEWLNGATLFDVRDQNNGPLPLEVGLSYLLGVMAAIQVGHDRDILHLDIKPENIIVLTPGDQLKVIDYGGCQFESKGGLQDHVTTDGYSAPELELEHPIYGGKPERPCKGSDVFALGRLFLSLCFNFSLKGKYRFALPSPAEAPAFAEMESVYRFVKGLTAINPDERMTLPEAYETACALRYEVIALKDRRPVVWVSSAFAADTSKGTELSLKTLPRLLTDRRDVTAPMIEQASVIPDLSKQRFALEQILLDNPQSMEAKLTLAGLCIDIGDLDFTKRLLKELARANPCEWRNAYHLGRLSLAQGEIEFAARCFDACYSARPAEVAIKLACGYCAELLGNNARASRFYETASLINPDYTAGPFGWARVAIREGDLATAIEAYNRVPRTSWAFNQAVIGKVQTLIKILLSASSQGIGLPELLEAAASASLVATDGESYEAYRLQADVIMAAIAALRAGSLKPDKTITLLGVVLKPRALRKAASDALINCSRFVAERGKRFALVDEARRISGFRLF